MTIYIIILCIAVVVFAATGYFIGKRGAAPEVAALKANLENALVQVEVERRHSAEQLALAIVALAGGSGES